MHLHKEKLRKETAHRIPRKINLSLRMLLCMYACVKVNIAIARDFLSHDRRTMPHLVINKMCPRLF